MYCSAGGEIHLYDNAKLPSSSSEALHNSCAGSWCLLLLVPLILIWHFFFFLIKLHSNNTQFSFNLDCAENCGSWKQHPSCKPEDCVAPCRACSGVRGASRRHYVLLRVCDRCAHS